MKKLIFLLIGAILLSGCAGYRQNADGSMDTYGFFRTLTVREDYYADGSLKSKVISTDTPTRDYLLGLNEFIDTAVNTAAKLKP